MGKIIRIIVKTVFFIAYILIVCVPGLAVGMFIFKLGMSPDRLAVNLIVSVVGTTVAALIMAKTDIILEDRARNIWNKINDLNIDTHKVVGTLILAGLLFTLGVAAKDRVTTPATQVSEEVRLENEIIDQYKVTYNEAVKLIQQFGDQGDTDVMISDYAWHKFNAHKMTLHEMQLIIQFIEANADCYVDRFDDTDYREENYKLQTLEHKLEEVRK